MRPLGTPPIPRAMSRDSEPVGWIHYNPRILPQPHDGPLPYVLSSWARQVSSAFFLSAAGAADSIMGFFCAMSIILSRRRLRAPASYCPIYYTFLCPIKRTFSYSSAHSCQLFIQGMPSHSLPVWMKYSMAVITASLSAVVVSR